MLFKNVLRTFKKKIIQLSAVGIVIFLSSFIFTQMFYAISSIEKPAEQFFAENKQENFSIDMMNTLTKNELKTAAEKYNLAPGIYSLTSLKKQNKDIYYKIIQSRQKMFEDKYTDYSLELREFKDLSLNSHHKIRVIKNSEKMNLPMIEQGRIPSADNEIAITRIYAKKNNINLNDSLKMDGKSYKITGYVLFPDYNLPMFGNEMVICTDMQTLGLVTDSEYEKLKGKEDFHFAGIYNGKRDNFNDAEFEKNVIQKVKNDDNFAFVTDIKSTKNQMRSGAVYDELKGGKAMSLGISFMIAAIGIIIVAIIICKLIRSERGQIGILKALGYSDTEITIPYMLLIGAVSLPALVIGYVGGKFSSVSLQNIYLDYYLLPATGIQPQIAVFLTAILLPLIFFVGISMLIIRKMLSKKTISLLKAGDNEKVNKLNKLVSKILKNAKASTKFKYSFIFSNLGKFFVFFICIVFVSILLMYSFMSIGSFDKITTGYYQSVGYNYQGYIDISKPLPVLKNEQEKFLEYPDAKYNGNSIILTGIENDSTLNKLFNKKGENITSKLKDGIIVNNAFTKKYDKEVGDSIKVKIGDNDFTLVIKGISNDYSGIKIYSDLSNLSDMATNGKSDELFNGVYSKTSLNKDDYLTVVNKADILKQAQTMNKSMQYSVYSMMLCSILIPIIVLGILTSLTVEDKYYDISLLKVMGYTDKEVNSMILNSYFVYSILSFLISVPISVGIFNIIEKYLLVKFNKIMPLEFKLWHVFAGVGLTAVMFLIGTISAKKKINHVPLQEILKQYRE